MINEILNKMQNSYVTIYSKYHLQNIGLTEDDINQLVNDNILTKLNDKEYFLHRPYNKTINADSFLNYYRCIRRYNFKDAYNMLLINLSYHESIDYDDEARIHLLLLQELVDDIDCSDVLNLLHYTYGIENDVDYYFNLFKEAIYEKNYEYASRYLDQLKDATIEMGIDKQVVIEIFETMLNEIIRKKNINSFTEDDVVKAIFRLEKNIDENNYENALREVNFILKYNRYDEKRKKFLLYKSLLECINDMMKNGSIVNSKKYSHLTYDLNTLEVTILEKHFLKSFEIYKNLPYVPKHFRYIGKLIEKIEVLNNKNIINLIIKSIESEDYFTVFNTLNNYNLNKDEVGIVNALVHALMNVKNGDILETKKITSDKTDIYEKIKDYIDAKDFITVKKLIKELKDSPLINIANNVLDEIIEQNNKNILSDKKKFRYFDIKKYLTLKNYSIVYDYLETLANGSKLSQFERTIYKLLKDLNSGVIKYSYDEIYIDKFNHHGRFFEALKCRNYHIALEEANIIYKSKTNPEFIYYIQILNEILEKVNNKEVTVLNNNAVSMINNEYKKIIELIGFNKTLSKDQINQLYDAFDYIYNIHDQFNLDTTYLLYLYQIVEMIDLLQDNNFDASYFSTLKHYEDSISDLLNTSLANGNYSIALEILNKYNFKKELKDINYNILVIIKKLLNIFTSNLNKNHIINIKEDTNIKPNFFHLFYQHLDHEDYNNALELYLNNKKEMEIDNEVIANLIILSNQKTRTKKAD